MSTLPKAPGTSPQESPRPAGARLIVVEQVAHLVPGQEPTPVETRFGRPLESEEQTYKRVVTVGEEWTALDFGWVEAASMIVVQNREGERGSVKPTPEERAAVRLRVVEIGTLGTQGATSAAWEVPPGESFRGRPVGSSGYFLRCRSGKAKVIVTVIPR